MRMMMMEHVHVNDVHTYNLLDVDVGDVQGRELDDVVKDTEEVDQVICICNLSQMKSGGGRNIEMRDACRGGRRALHHHPSSSSYLVG